MAMGEGGASYPYVSIIYVDPSSSEILITPVLFTCITNDFVVVVVFVFQTHQMSFCPSANSYPKGSLSMAFGEKSTLTISLASF